MCPPHWTRDDVQMTNRDRLRVIPAANPPLTTDVTIGDSPRRCQMSYVPLKSGQLSVS
jgi:hypothetical protein